MTNHYQVKWKYSEPEDSMYGDPTDQEYKGTVYADNASKACSHYYEPGTNYITSCVQVCKIPKHMQEQK